MIDYFALFQEARRPWLDPDKLKEKYFALVRERPADAELNEAFRVLRDPKLRLQHLLRLQGIDLGARREIPSPLANLFCETGQLVREVDRWQLKNSEANNALARALLRGEQLKLKEQIAALAERLNVGWSREIAQLQAMNLHPLPNDHKAFLQIYDALSYLTRLRDQLKEKQLLLA